MSSAYKRGEVCGVDNCRSRRWITDDYGIAVCENGHQRQGARGPIPEDEDAFGSLAKVQRRKKELEKLESKHLSGRAALNLYLLCYQLVLRKQIWWLTREKGLPDELEEIVRALWEQRLNSLARRATDHSLEENSEPELFSTQVSDTESETEGLKGIRDVKLSHTPNIMQSLGFCYLGIYLLRLPILLGDLIRWVKDEQLPFNNVYEMIPTEMTERLFAFHAEMLRWKKPIEPKLLYRNTVQLFAAYQLELKMELPPLNWPLHLYRLIQDLALPIDIYPAVKQLAGLLSYGFDFSKDTLPVTELPETKLIALVVVATKLFYPMDSTVRHPVSPHEPAAAVMDWDLWLRSCKARRDGGGGGGGSSKNAMSREDAMALDELDVLYMSDERLDHYMDWYAQSGMVRRKSGMDKANVREFAMDLQRMFPVDAQGGGRGAGDEGTENVMEDENDGNELADLGVSQSKRLREVQRGLIVREAVTEEEMERMTEDGKVMERPGAKYRRFRRVRDLEGMAKEFYDEVSDLTGIPLPSLLAAVMQAEFKLEQWTIMERRLKAS